MENDYDTNCVSSNLLFIFKFGPYYWQSKVGKKTTETNYKPAPIPPEFVHHGDRFLSHPTAVGFNGFASPMNVFVLTAGSCGQQERHHHDDSSSYPVRTRSVKITSPDRVRAAPFTGNWPCYTPFVLEQKNPNGYCIPHAWISSLHCSLVKIRVQQRSITLMKTKWIDSQWGNLLSVRCSLSSSIRGS